MKRAISILLLAGSLILTGCGDSNTDFTQVSGQQGNPAPIVTPTPTSAYFVDATNGNDTTAAANPTSNTPFATIQAAVTNAPVNTTITVRAGTYTGAVTLKDGQRLLGVASGNRPVLNSTLTLANGNTVDFLEFRNINGRAIDANGRNGGTITNVVIDTTTGTGGLNGTGTGVLIADSSGTWDVSDNSIADTGGFPIAFQVTGTAQLTATVNGNTITGGVGGIGFLTGNTSDVLAQIHDNQISSVGFTGVDILVADDSSFGLDLEDNTSDKPYSLFLSPFGGTNTFSVEQLTALTTAKPAGAGNTGIVDDGTADGGKLLTEVPNDSLGF